MALVKCIVTEQKPRIPIIFIEDDTNPSIAYQLFIDNGELYYEAVANYQGSYSQPTLIDDSTGAHFVLGIEATKLYVMEV